MWLDFKSIIQHYCTGSQRNDVYDVGGLIKITGASKSGYDCDIRSEDSESSSIIYDLDGKWDESSATLPIYFLNNNDPHWALLKGNCYAAFNAALADFAVHDWILMVLML